MKDIQIWTDCPRNYNSKGFDCTGGSPAILENLIDFLQKNKEQIEMLNLCMYLYNNSILHEALVVLAASGIKIRVYSIPLEGYDDHKPMTIFDYVRDCAVYNTAKTKYDLAETVYNSATRAPELFELRICPHMFIRYNGVEPFSRGKMPYSLHCKSILAELKSGDCMIGLTSATMAVREMSKYEIMVLGRSKSDEAAAARDFFAGLYENSFSAKIFDTTTKYFEYRVTTREQPSKCRNMYIAPYYSDSPDFFEYALTSIILKAKKQIVICAQHISAYEYSFKSSFKTEYPSAQYTKKSGFLSAVLEKAKEGIDVWCISQTFVDASGKDHGCRTTRNNQYFKKFIKAFSQLPNCHYSVNENTHSKFIVADDIAVITTCNFTPTQFIYLPFVNIDNFENISDQKYRGIHSEVGQFIVIQEHTSIEKLITHFNEIFYAKDTYHYC